MTILAFLQKALKDLTASEFTVMMHHFLKAVRTHPLHYALVITSVLALIVALFILRENAGSPTFVLVLAGLTAFVARPVPRIALLRRVELRRLLELEGRVATGGLAKGARPLLPPQQDPGTRLGGCLRSFSSQPVPTLTGGRGGCPEREPTEEQERRARTLVW